MILQSTIESKKIGSKLLLRDCSLTIERGEKIAIVGRNGVGKTTLFNILSGADEEFIGKINSGRGLSVVATKQEFDTIPQQTCLDYVITNLPNYLQLKKILDEYPLKKNHDLAGTAEYSDAVQHFSDLDYYDIENKTLQALELYQIDRSMALGEFRTLSGGEKRLVELVRVELSGASLALIDEPTNHMDYVAKAAFIKWFREVKHAVVVITHDRDVLAAVDRIIEIKDQKAVSFPGNYNAYLKQNSVSTITVVNQYELAQRTLVKLRQQLAFARARKAASPAYKIMEVRLLREYAELEASMSKPSVWIDQQSFEGLKGADAQKYDQYKDRNIRLTKQGKASHATSILKVKNLSLGYNQPLFSDLNFDLAGGDRLHLVGRNGVGKSTLVKTLIASITASPAQAKIFEGNVECNSNLKLGVYEQEISPQWLAMTLGEAIARIFQNKNLPVSDQTIRQAMSDYLFDPRIEFAQSVGSLSGGQKARLQIINMLADMPSLLILDEPTNHLDLPSIEELEKAMVNYSGAVIYVSHDSYFAKAIGGEELPIGPVV